MLTTLITEFGLTLYTAWRYRLNTTGRLVAVTLISLATFQVAEYHVCTTIGLNAAQWSRLGYVAITTTAQATGPQQERAPSLCLTPRWSGSESM